MIFTDFLAKCWKKNLQSGIEFTQYGRHFLILSIIGLTLTACGGGGGGDSLPGSNNNNTTALTISESETVHSGSVGDGPIIEAQITVSDINGAVLDTVISDATANYSVSAPQGSAYPLMITATGGTDVVTGTAPDFTLVSVAISPSVKTVNINPFSTLIVKTAQAMPRGLTSANLLLAKRNIAEHLNFGLDPALVPDAIATPINETNVGTIIKASEALGETLRRTREALLVSGQNLTGDEIIDTIAGDMTDGLLDGRGPGANVRVAAIANIVSGQVLIEALGNHLNVGGADATTLMDVAINLSVSSAIMTTADVVITNGMLTQSQIAVAAATKLLPSPDLSAVAVILAGLSGGILSADINAVLPTDSAAAFNEVIAQAPLSTDSQLELVNASVRAGNTVAASTIEPSPEPTPAAGTIEFSAAAYSVNESDGIVNITINRVGGSAGEITVEWRTQGVTATFAQDYGDFGWTPLTFVDGETSKVETISIVSDTLVEDDETFNVLLGNPTNGATLGTQSSAVVTITESGSTTSSSGSTTSSSGSTTSSSGSTTSSSGSTTSEPTTAPSDADFYVSPNGNDSNPGTITQPFATIQNAINQASAGDLIYVRGGNYQLSSQISISGKSGGAGNEIKLFAYPGETPVLDGSNLTGTNLILNLANASYWHIKGLELMNSPSHGMRLQGSSNNNIIEALNIHGSGRLNTTGSGMHIGGSASYNLILNVESHHNKDTTLGNADGFAVKSPDAIGNIFRGSRAHHNSDDGWDLWTGGPVTIEDCRSWENGLDDAGNRLGDGNGFKLGKGNGGHIVKNNMAWGNAMRGFDYNASGANFIYNNTAFDNPTNYYFINAAHVLRNNISYQGSVNLDSNVDDQNNTWNLGITDPGFISTDPNSQDFLKPAADSDVIDAGIDIGLPYSGNAPDLGAIEQ